MISVKKMALACLVSLGLVSAVNANTLAGKEKESISQKVQSAVGLPKELKTPGFSETVKVFFRVDEKGNVVEEVAATNNAQLRQCIEKQFRQICFSELSPQTPYNIEIKFIVQ